MSEILQVIEALQHIAPVPTIAISLIIILFLVKGNGDIKNIRDNHLDHVQATLDEIRRILERNGEKMDRVVLGVEYLKAKSNGKKR